MSFNIINDKIKLVKTNLIKEGVKSMDIKREYKKKTIEISQERELDLFDLAVSIINNNVIGNNSYMIYENEDEISLGIGEYIGIEVYKNKILLTQEGHSVEYVVNDLSEDIKKIFNELNFDDWRMYGIADFNYAKNTFLKNVSDKEVVMKLFIPRTDIRILKDSLEIKTIDNFDEIILNFDTERFDLEDKDFNVNLEEVKNLDGDYYKEIVKKAIGEIKNDKYDKVILSRKINLEKKISIKDSYLKGRKFNTPARSYCFRIGDLEAVGFSPETVVEVDKKRQVYTFPLAGTRALTNDLAINKELKRELLKDPKEIAEHAVSVKLAFQELERVCDEDSISVIRFMDVLERGTVQHLASRLKGTLRKEFNEWHAFTALFPAVTASGIPKKECIEAIDRIEKDKRGIYSGGVLTYDKNGTLDVALALRTAYQTSAETWIRVGAGIVKLSNCKRELEETKEKSGSILDELVFEEE